MSPVALLVGIVFVTGFLLILGVFAVAAGRGPRAELFSPSDLIHQAPAKKPIRRREKAEIARAEPPTDLLPDREPVTDLLLDRRPPTDPMLDREAVTADEYAVTRRRFFNRALIAVFGLFLAQFALASVAFIWPKLKGGFGSAVTVGKVSDLKAEIIQGGTVVPKFFPTARAWVIPFELDLIPGSSYEGLPDVVTGGENDGIALTALWMKCPHLGCRVPECVPSQGFECPCHGSKFNIHGEYAAGPAPRNMDRFAVSTNEQGELVIDTSQIFETSRSKTYTAKYPLGPFCV
ncbi:MAG: hypothetical protein BMS9Abin07_1424 [Acidimicrobiia bacterium]|nr:MAG: hypothetical protein BMS9Abin07_1424 [Acidimicrobiia bacterium]